MCRCFKHVLNFLSSKALCSYIVCSYKKKQKKKTKRKHGYKQNFFLLFYKNYFYKNHAQNSKSAKVNNILRIKPRFELPAIDKISKMKSARFVTLCR